MMQEPTITGATAFLTIVLMVLVFLVPRKYVLPLFVLTACFIPADQYVDIFALHFYVGRILVFTGAARLLLRGELEAIRWNRLDKLVLAWVAVGTVAFFLRRPDTQALIYKSGVIVDILGAYWITRQTVRSWDHMKYAVAWFAVSMIALVPFVASEWSTGVNPFVVLGAPVTTFRSEAYRCVASFRHPIVAGVFIACLVPFFISQGLTSRHKLLYWLAVPSAAFIVLASNSSTPIGGLAAILFFCAVYQYRHYGRYMAISFFGALAALHIVMQGPVWHLLSRIQFVGGSTGWHRYILIDAAIRHFSEWMFLGTNSTAHWGPQLFDVTNQFILEGVRGGALTLGLFIAVLVLAVQVTGAYSLRTTHRDQKWLSWALCTSILGHCIMFLGLGYFGQVQILLYMTFGFAAFVYEQNALLSTRIRFAREAHIFSGVRGTRTVGSPIP